jgi:diacylglycerol kinase family enzyme
MLIHNPAAGRGRGRLQTTLARLRALGSVPEVWATARRGEAEALARAAVERGYDLVVAAGGDGTVNEVINGLIGDGPAGDGRPLALLPLGTANVLATEIDLDLEPAALAKTILHGRPVDICLGRIRGPDGVERRFTTVAGAGADAHAVASVDLVGKRVLGTGAYYAEMARQLLVFPFPNYRITVDGTAYDAASVVVSNGRHYAGQYILAPDADLTEPSFQVCLFERGGRLAALRYVMALQLDRLVEEPDYRIVTGRKVRIEGPKGDPVQADGDIVAALPVDIEIMPGALRLMMPDFSGKTRIS